MWGPDPWDNDIAADWFGNFMDRSKMPQLVRETIFACMKEVDDRASARIRAAAYCVLCFGRTYIWPINDIEADIQLAVAGLEKILLDEEYCYSDEMRNKIMQEIATLRSRI